MNSFSEIPPTQTRRATDQERQELKREIIDFVKLVVWFLVIFLGLRTFVIEGYEVQGPSMWPTLENNERILVFKLPHELSKHWPFRSLNAIEPGDIVVFDSPDDVSKRYVKRVMAMGPKVRNHGTVVAESQDDAGPRPRVDVRYEDGFVFVNNRRVDEEYLSPEARDRGDAEAVSLGPGEYYVLGDNRRVSKDSRSFEAIQENAIIGKAVFRFWPPHKISFLR